MPAHKISKSRKHSKRSHKYSSKVNQKDGAITYEYLNGTKWIPARDYQKEVLTEMRMKNLKNHTYNKNGIFFNIRFLYLNEDNYNEMVYEFVRQDGTNGFLRQIGYSDGFMARMSNI